MSYAQGGLIQATDYNTLVGTSPSSTITALNTVWAVGSGSAGWGQSAITQSAALAGLITATQWATLVNTLNSANTHIAGTSSGLTANTAGQVIGFSGSLQGKINGIYSDRLKFDSNSAVIAGSSLAAVYSNGSTSAPAVTFATGARATFTSADAARYFFNAGGRLKFNVSGAQSASTTARTNAIIALCTNMGGVALFGANTNGGRTGSGGTLGTNDVAKGYWTSTYNSNVSVVAVTSTTANYTTDTASIVVNPNGTQGTNNGNGSQVNFFAIINSTTGGGSFDDSYGVSVTKTIDVSYPELSNLSNTWGAVTITQL